MLDMLISTKNGVTQGFLAKSTQFLCPTSYETVARRPPGFSDTETISVRK